MSTIEPSQFRKSVRLEIRRRQIQQQFKLFRTNYKYQNPYLTQQINQQTYHLTTNQPIHKYKNRIQTLLNTLKIHKQSHNYKQISNSIQQFIYQLQQQQKNLNKQLNTSLTTSFNQLCYENSQKILQFTTQPIHDHEYQDSPTQQQDQHPSHTHNPDTQQTNNPYHQQTILKIINMGVNLLNRLTPSLLKIQSMVLLIKLLWHLLQQTTTSHPPNSSQNLPHYQIKILINILSLLNKQMNKFTNYNPISSYNHDIILLNAIAKNTLSTLGIKNKLIQLIHFNMQFDQQFKCFLLSQSGIYSQNVQISENQQHCKIDGKLIVQLHHVLLQTIQNITTSQFQPTEQTRPQQQQQSSFILNQPQLSQTQATINKHNLAYGIYILTTLSPFYNSSTTSQQSRLNHQLYKQSLIMLIPLIHHNIQLIQYIPDSMYQPFINILLMEQTQQQHSSPTTTIAQHDQITLYTLKLLLILTKSQQLLDSLILNYNILSALHHQLLHTLTILPIIHHKHNHYIFQITIKLCTNNIIHLLYSCNKNTKKYIFHHQIWQLIFTLLSQYTTSYTYLFLIFPYYFIAYGQKQALKTLPKFLSLISKLQLTNIYLQHMHQIQTIIKQVYEDCNKYMNQDNISIVKYLYHTSGLLTYVDHGEYMEDMIE